MAIALAKHWLDAYVPTTWAALSWHVAATISVT